MRNLAQTKFSFDHWSRLAQKDPDAFEVQRKLAIERVIAQAPLSKQRRLRGLQWQIDVLRQRAGSPLSACHTLSNLMWESLLGRDGLVESWQAATSVRDLRRNQKDPFAPSRKSAQILPFPKG